MKYLAVFLAAGLISGCAAPLSQSAPFSGSSRHDVQRSGPSGKITHVVIVMQENRSFDNMFYGFPGANTATSGVGHGKTYPLKPLPLKWTHDLNHYHWQFLEDYDGGLNDGFDDQIIGFKTGSGCTDPVNHPSCWIFQTGKAYLKLAFSYVRQSDIQPYWTMAQQYALGDDNFASNNGPSFPAHQYLIAGQAGHADEVPTRTPWGCDAPKETENYLQYGQAVPPEFPPATGIDVAGPDPCFSYTTAAQLLDNAGVSWRWYVQPPQQDSYWLSAFDAISAIRYGPDWANVVKPDTKILTDIANGQLQQVSWVMPHGGASDHAGNGSGSGGPAWVASIVNAIGESSYGYWNNTAIIITWDEWGGWYDHVVPPQYPDPVTLAYEGLGYRVPLIVVSPYARAGYISHQQHETASSLHFLENTFGLPSLGLADARADAYDDMFDFNQSPIPFQPIPSSVNARYFLSHPATQPEIDY
jgi:phospholipase C